MMKSRVLFLIAALALTGCASSPLELVTGALGSKPDVTAQVGAENVKQGVGLSNKVDASNEVKNELKNSKVDNLDTSNGKKVSTSSISAGTITADKIEIRNGSDREFYVMVSLIAAIILSGVSLYFINRNKKAPK